MCFYTKKMLAQKSCFEADQSNETNDVHHDFAMERVLQMLQEVEFRWPHFDR